MEIEATGHATYYFVISLVESSKTSLVNSRASTPIILIQSFDRMHPQPVTILHRSRPHTLFQQCLQHRFIPSICVSSSTILPRTPSLLHPSQKFPYRQLKDFQIQWLRSRPFVFSYKVARNKKKEYPPLTKAYSDTMIETIAGNGAFILRTLQMYVLKNVVFVA